MIEINQQIAEHDWRAAVVLHFRTHRSSVFRPWAVTLVIVSGIALLWLQGTMGATKLESWFGSFFRTTGLVFLVVGALSPFTKRIKVWRSIKEARTSKVLSRPYAISIDSEGKMKTIRGEDTRTRRLDGLMGFAVGEIGVLIYGSRNSFLLLKRDSFGSPDQVDEFVELLKKQGVQQLKVW